MTAQRTPHDPPAVLVRPLGASERAFYRFSERNPAHHVAVAEFAEPLPVDGLRSALGAVQRRHPLLSMHVEDRPDTRLGFYREPTVAPIPLTTRRSADPSWEAAAADELTRPFDRSQAPLMRALLLQAQPRSTLLLTFDHTLADGISTMFVLRDVLRALNGQTLSELALRRPQERLIDDALGDVEAYDPAAQPQDPRMLRANVFRPFDGAPTKVRTMALSAWDTARLVGRCRTERTTVHAALVAAMSRVRAVERGEDFVRTLNPINCRALMGVGDDCGMFIQSVTTGIAPLSGTPFWEQARETTAQLDLARAPRGIRTLAMAGEQLMTVDADTDRAEELFGRLCPWDLLITNLGVQHFDGIGPLRPTAVWAPVVQSQTVGEYVTGVTTYEGQLRMATCGYSVPSTFLKSVAETLLAAVEQP
ncbi:hypothetical protein A5714_20025 [Mycobacterium sp. E2462]|uniref:condensation domain-containing protein n=1 Tax=Mycobacterium sp. E2462 TaxID=1834133 RepID=UPI000802000A|nr:condensation domain-containing protein [Mycobacterium sp. E2462]OBI09297.1 hypothetical protein A5714_20025 [Mycobacterium sp. E2462]